MKLKTSYKYQLSDHRNEIAIFYTIIILVFCVAVYLSYINPEMTGEFNGIYITTMIFLVIIGLCGFKSEFLFLMQNGISRKTILVSRMLTATTISAIMALVDTSIYFIVDEINIFKLQVFHPAVSDINLLYALILTFFIYLSVISVGYVVAISNYRLGTKGKKILYISAIFVFVLISALDTFLFDNKIMWGLTKFVDFAYGITVASAINAIVASICIFAICSIVSYLLIRRVPVKE